MKKELTDKIKQIILEDRQSGLIAFERVLKSDIFCLLCNYLNDILDITVSISTENDSVNVKIAATASSLQKVGSIIES